MPLRRLPAGTFHHQLSGAADLALLAAVAAPHPRLDVVGHSYGGLLALHLARALGPRVRSLGVHKLVALSLLREGDAAAQREWQALQAPFWTDAAQGGSAAWIARFVDHWSGEGAFARLPAAVRDPLIAAGPTVFRQVGATRADPSTLADFAAITCPVLAMHGSGSTAAGACLHRLLLGALPGAQACVLEGAPHMGPMTHARAFNAALQSFHAAR